MDEEEEETPVEPDNALVNVERSDDEVQLQTTSLEVEKQRNEIHSLAESDGHVPISSIVITCCVIGTFALIVLIWYAYYSLTQVQTHDADLEEKIVSGNTIATLRALKSQTVQSYSTIYILIILVMILFGTIAFGYVVFYKDASSHSRKKILKVARMGSDAINSAQRRESELKVILSAQTQRVRGLTGSVRECNRQIEELCEKDRTNVRQIRLLQEQKMEKEAELRAAGVELKHMVERYEEAAKHTKDLKDDIRKEKQAKKVLKQELTAGKMQISHLERDLKYERSEAEQLRNRTNHLESSQEQSRRKIHELEIDRVKLRTEKERAESEKELTVGRIEAERKRAEERTYAEKRRVEERAEAERRRAEEHYRQLEAEKQSSEQRFAAKWESAERRLMAEQKRAAQAERESYEARIEAAKQTRPLFRFF